MCNAGGSSRKGKRTQKYTSKHRLKGNAVGKKKTLGVNTEVLTSTQCWLGDKCTQNNTILSLTTVYVFAGTAFYVTA